MVPFDFQPRTRIVFGAGQGRLARRIGRRAGGAAGAGRQRSGHRRGRTRRARPRGAGSAPASRRSCSTASTRIRRPTTSTPGWRSPGGYEPELIVGLGGGSSMDCAKGINFLYSNGGRMQDYWGIGKATRADAADDRRADHRRHRQRNAIVRPDLRRQDARQDGLRRQEGRRSASRCSIPTLTVTQPRARDGADRHRRHRPCAGDVRHASCAIRLSLAFSREAWLLLGENFRPRARRSGRSGSPRRHATGRLLRRAGDRELDARRRPTRWPIR